MAERVKGRISCSLGLLSLKHEQIWQSAPSYHCTVQDGVTWNFVKWRPFDHRGLVQQASPGVKPSVVSLAPTIGISTTCIVQCDKGSLPKVSLRVKSCSLAQVVRWREDGGDNTGT